MADTYLKLRPYGDGYSVVETDRTDSPLFFTRYFVGNNPSADTFSTGVGSADYIAFIVGMNFDNAGTVFQSAYMEETYETWHIAWDVAENLGSDAFFDVLFISRGLCAEVDQPLNP